MVIERFPLSHGSHLPEEAQWDKLSVHLHETHLIHDWVGKSHLPASDNRSDQYNYIWTGLNIL